MATDAQVQEIVHRLEEGRWKKWVQLGALLATVIALYTAFIFDPFYWGLFKGLSHPKAMEQAQIAREVARGNGFSTKMLRPVSLAQFQRTMGSIPVDQTPDTYHAPLWPVTLAPFLKTIESKWAMTTRDYVYAADRMIAAVGTLFFLLSVLVNYFTMRRLFDHQLAILTVGLLLACDLFWKFSMSGLPQMLMAFEFSLATLFLVRAVENRTQELPFKRWLIAASVVFGLMALTHAISIWIFAGTLFFCGFYFKPRVPVLLIMTGVFMLVYSPWLVRTYHVVGSPMEPFGIAPLSGLYQIRGTESEIMRGAAADFGNVSPTMFRQKIQNQLTGHFASLFGRFGQSLVAPIFFVALLHLFKRRDTGHVRWLLFSMWVFAVLGMAAFGSDDGAEPLQANDLDPLFIPLFSAYGLAFLLVMWTRLEIHIKLLRVGFIVLLFGVSAMPLANTFTSSNRSVVQWPPYVPPYIAILHDWTDDQEIIASDMPWAVAWYADRKSLWLPKSIQSFIDLNDYGRLGGRIVGLYLTPMSGNRAFIADIVKGEYKEWAPFILRTANVKEFPLKSVTALPIDNQCIFYSDHDRWTDRMD